MRDNIEHNVNNNTITNVNDDTKDTAMIAEIRECVIREKQQ